MQLKQLIEEVETLFEQETKLAEPYKDLFEFDELEALLRKYQIKSSTSAFEFADFLECKLKIELTEMQNVFILALPVLAFFAETHCEKKYGSMYCADKTIFILKKLFKKLGDENDEAQDNEHVE